MTLAVDLGRKATKTNKQTNDSETIIQLNKQVNSCHVHIKKRNVTLLNT